MHTAKVAAVQQWPVPTTAKDVRSFLGLVGYYRRFIKNFAATAAPLTELTKAAVPWKWSSAEQTAFQALKVAITEAPVLLTADPTLPYEVFTDASGFATGAVLLQDQGKGLQPVAYHSTKLSEAERKYPVHEQEMLAVVTALRAWRCYLQGSVFKINSDHQTLRRFQTQPNLSARQARWSEFLQTFDCTISYVPGDKNQADALSRRPDLMALLDIQPDNEFLSELSASYADDPFVQQDATRSKPKLRKNNEMYYHAYEDKLYVTPKMRRRLLLEAHAAVYSGHLGVDKTTATLSQQFYWPHLRRTVAAFVRCCHECQLSKPTNHRPFGLLQPLPTPDHPWQHITMDFITDLPLTDKKHDSIVVFVDRFTKMFHAAPTTKAVTAQKLADIFNEQVFRYHGLPESIVSDRDPKMDSDFWRSVQGLLGTELKMSTAYHPETDGQTERANRTLKEMLRSYVNTTGTNWDSLLTPLEFAYNNSQQASTKQSPFYLSTGIHPRTPVTALRPVNLPPERMDSEQLAQHFVQTFQHNLDSAKVHLRSAQLRQKHYADQHRMQHNFTAEDQVILWNQHYNIPDCNRHPLSQCWTGPFRIVDVTGETVKLRLPDRMNFHPRVHVSQLRRYHPNADVGAPPPLPPSLVQQDSTDEIWEISHICGERRTVNEETGRRRTEYRVRYKYPPHNTPEQDEWYPVVDLRAGPSIRQFKRMKARGTFDPVTGVYTPDP